MRRVMWIGVLMCSSSWSLVGCASPRTSTTPAETIMPKRMSTAEANRRGAEAERWHYRHNLRGYSRVGNPVDHTYIWKTTTTDTIEQVLRYYAAQTGLPNLAQLDDAGTTNFDSTVPGRPAVVFDTGQAGISRRPGDPPAPERMFGVRRDGYSVTCLVTPAPGGQTRIVVVHDWTP